MEKKSRFGDLHRAPCREAHKYVDIFSTYIIPMVRDVRGWPMVYRHPPERIVSFSESDSDDSDSESVEEEKPKKRIARKRKNTKRSR